MKYTVDYAITEDDLSYIVDLYQNQDGFDYRTDSGIQDSIANSDGVIAIRDPEADEIVGFARMLTDQAFQAMIVDPVVKTDSDNLGTKLVSAIYSHPDLDETMVIMLYCLKGWETKYRSWGFEDPIFATI